jgi:hypothetical protein
MSDKLTGSDVNYYTVAIAQPKRLEPYTAEAEDIIEALGMTFAEGCAFKAIWRSCAARTLGVVKTGAEPHGIYDAEKVVYYGSRMLAQRRKAIGLPTAINPPPVAPTKEKEPDGMKKFLASIAAMNAMYKLPLSPTLTTLPGEPIHDRMPKFMKTMQDEILEGDKLFADSLGGTASGVNMLVDIADLLGDIVVYAFSEAAKYGIPLEQVLEIIMESNESKLGEDGEPIYNAEGKFLKGPNYFKPEPKIEQLFVGIMAGYTK